MRASRHIARGFSGIEAAIVTVILGVVFILALKGAALVQTVRARITVFQIQQIQAKVQSYQVEFKNKLPGDDPNAPERWARELSTFAINRGQASLADDGILQGDLTDPTNANGEQYMAWRDLRYAGLLDGDPELKGESARPENLFGGFFGFAERNLGLQQVVCLTKVPGEAARLIDQSLDDGKVGTGRLVGTSQWDPSEARNEFSAPDSTSYDPEKTYIICTPFLP